MSPGKTAALLSLLFFAVAGLYLADGALKVQHDAGVYLSLARSLATGQGYRQIHLIDTPPHTKYPPLFPLLLAPVLHLLGHDFFTMKLILVAVGLLSLGILYLLIRRLAGVSVALLVVSFTATSPGILFYAQSIMSEIPYLFFSLLALFWLHHSFTGDDRARPARFLAIVSIPFAYLTRLIGLVLLPAAALYALCEAPGRFSERLKRALIFAGLAAIPAVAWFARNRLVGQLGGSLYWEEYAGPHVAAASDPLAGLIALVARLEHNVEHNAPRYLIHIGRIIFFHRPLDSDTFIPLFLAAFVAVGFLLCAVRRRSILEYYVFFYVCTAVAFPGTRPQRYLVPVIPFVWYYFIVAARQVLAVVARGAPSPGLPGRFATTAAKIAAVILLAANAGASAVANAANGSRDTYYHVAGEDHYSKIEPWVRAHTAPDSVFMWAKAALRFLSTDRRGVNYAYISRETMLDLIRSGKVDYVVVDTFSGITQSLLRPVIESHPHLFQHVHSEHGTEVYQVVGAEARR